MTSKNITMHEDVYNMLVQQKLPGESFSQMFKRTMGESSNKY